MEVRVGIPNKALLRTVASWPPSRVRAQLVSVARKITCEAQRAPLSVPRHQPARHCSEPWTDLAKGAPGAAAAAAAAASLLLLQASAAGAYEPGGTEVFNPEAYAGRWYEVGGWLAS